MKAIQLARQSRQENLIYLAVWTLLFAAPILSLYVRTANETDVRFNWHEVFFVWSKLSLYLLLFLLHNFFLAPLLTDRHRQKRMAYFSIMALVLAAFTMYQCSNRPSPIHTRHLHTEQVDIHAFPPPDIPSTHQRRPPHLPPPVIGEHDILSVIVLVLMFMANLGSKAYFKSKEDRKRMDLLERQNLSSQLEYLRLQISPHFFMNTLNNIHALIDINPAKAQETIVELSKIMRFVLYEGNNQYVPLTRELDFIANYMKLMKLRYTDNVRINLQLPHRIPDSQIPPLLLTTFIENAFKHGVSYRRETFIQVNISIDDDTLLFTCSNTRNQATSHRMPVDSGGGMGLTNVRKRLDLLYPDTYRLEIHEQSDTYTVLLTIPLRTPAATNNT
ncbi:MAG: histidine kinase [Bacteroidaceae bacterium]|nr:histidine kinase [Bacteroidaceae bacterium]